MVRCVGIGLSGLFAVCTCAPRTLADGTDIAGQGRAAFRREHCRRSARLPGEGITVRQCFTYLLLVGVLCAALISCGRRPMTTEQLADDLDYSDPADREYAADELGARGETAQAAVPELIKALEDREEDVRFRVARALGKLGDIAAVPALTVALDDTCPAVRWESAIAIGKLNGAAALRDLVEHLGDESAHVRVHVSEAIAKLGDVERALPGLIAGLDDLDHDVRFCAAYALVELAPHAGSAVPALTRRLSDPEARVRAEAACALGRITEAAEPAIPASSDATGASGTH